MTGGYYNSKWPGPMRLSATPFYLLIYPNLLIPRRLPMRRLLSLCALLCLLAGSALAVPQTLSHQGQVFDGTSLNITLWSYCGKANLCILADSKVLSDGWVLYGYFCDELARLNAAGSRGDAEDAAAE